MRELKGCVKVIPIPVREDDWRLLAFFDVEIGRKGVAIEGDRRADVEVQNGAPAIVTK
jgi:hypothetical protein